MGKELFIGAHIRCIDTNKIGVVLDFLTKEETKQSNMFGQLVKIKLEDGSIEERCYDYEILDETNWKEFLLSSLDTLNKGDSFGFINGKKVVPEWYLENLIVGICPKFVIKDLLSKVEKHCYKSKWGYQYDIEIIIDVIKNYST